LQQEYLRREIGLLSSIPSIEEIYDKNAVRARRLSISIFHRKRSREKAFSGYLARSDISDFTTWKLGGVVFLLWK
jgi:hypothetical protein